MGYKPTPRVESNPIPVKIKTLKDSCILSSQTPLQSTSVSFVSFSLFLVLNLGSQPNMEEKDAVIQPLKKLQKTSRYTRAKITRLCNAIEFSADPLDENQRILNLEKLKSLVSSVQN